MRGSLQAVTRSSEEARIPSHGCALVADVYRPKGKGPHPAIVMAHGFGGIRRGGLPSFAGRFQAAGLVVVLFDYRHFGDSEGSPRQILSVPRQLQDWHAALRFTRRLPDVDGSRVGLWGTSFSGGHVVRVAAEDENVAAVVAQVPFASGVRTVAKLPLRSAFKMAAAGLADLVWSGILRGRPIQVPITGPPGSLAAMALNEAVEGAERLYRGCLWDNRVAARVGLATLLYRPLRHAGHVRCPLLVQVGEHDSLTPPEPARAMARRAPRGETRSYPMGHFDAYFDDGFDAVVADQVAFFRRHLAAPHALESSSG